MPGLKEALALFRRQWTVSIPEQKQSFVNQVVIVTGANTGLGKEAARRITANGASKVILAVRSVEKGEAAKLDIEATTSKTGVVEVWKLDLASFDSVKAFASRANSELSRLDVLLNNAGIATQDFKLAEGHESTVTVNVISTFLLSFLLLPKLKDTAVKHRVTPHLTIVSSEVQYFAQFAEIKIKDRPIFEVLADPKASTMTDRYNVSKLLEILVLQHLVPKFGPNYPVVVNSVNPGFCHSELMREVPWVSAVLKIVMAARPTEVGARTLVNAASHGPESHNKYLSDCKVYPVAPFVTSEDGKEAQVKVWEELETILNNIHPGVTANI